MLQPMRGRIVHPSNIGDSSVNFNMPISRLIVGLDFGTTYTGERLLIQLTPCWLF